MHLGAEGAEAPFRRIAARADVPRFNIPTLTGMRSQPWSIQHSNRIENLATLVATAPCDATLVVVHSAVLTYVSPEERQRFLDQVTDLPVHWISDKGHGVLPAVAAQAPAGWEDTLHRFLTVLDGRPLAWSGGPGQRVELL